MDRKRKIIASLADLKQDIAGPIPVDIISRWQLSGKTRHDQKVILEPQERSGFLVSTDSVGLSRLTGGSDLLQVMDLVSCPKEVIYAFGKEIGGRGVGVWSADNTEMFYASEKVSAELLLDRMAAAQKVIHQGVVQVGMGIHKGKFWEIGHGFFGEEAELIEKVAEDFTESKEILVSETVRAEIDPKHHGLFKYREDLSQFEQHFFTMDYDDWGQDFHAFKFPDPEEFNQNHFYPFPFGSDFFVSLKQMNRLPAALEKLQSFFSNKVVMLVKVYHKKERLLLDQLTDWVVVNAILNEIVVKYSAEVIKSNGDLGIFVMDSDNEAVELAEEILQYMKTSDDQVSIGISRGEVLLFNLDGGGRDIAGAAVNIASKISEDIQDRNSLYVESSVIIPAHQLAKFEKFSINKSQVNLKGYKYQA